MKAHLTQTQINQLIKVQEFVDKLRHKSYDEECKTYVRGYEVDRETFFNKLDCVSGSIEDLFENLLYF